MPTTPSELEKLKQHARQSYAAGRSFADNPFLRMARLPRQSGDSVEDWQAKHDAWRDGWAEEEETRRLEKVRTGKTTTA